MSTHTPGPWLFDYGDIGETEDVRYADIYTHDEIIIAEVNDCIPEFINNGHLLKAAPQLLEALKACIRELQKHENPLNYCSSVQLDGLAAIAQAEGKE